MVVVRHEGGETDREVVAGASVVAMAWWWVPVNEHMATWGEAAAGRRVKRRRDTGRRSRLFVVVVAPPCGVVFALN